jgi:hypothetical protein
MMKNDAHKNDVICGRGGLSNTHPGNRLFRRLVSANKDLYQRMVSPTRKQIVVFSITAAIHNRGGRFVRKQDGEWTEITGAEVAAKISQALRETYLLSPSRSSSSDEITEFSSPLEPTFRSSTSGASPVSTANSRTEMINDDGLRSSFNLAQTFFLALPSLCGDLSDSYDDDEDDFEPIKLAEIQKSPSPILTGPPIPSHESHQEEEQEGPIVGWDPASNPSGSY